MVSEYAELRCRKEASKPTAETPTVGAQLKTERRPAACRLSVAAITALAATTAQHRAAEQSGRVKPEASSLYLSAKQTRLSERDCYPEQNRFCICHDAAKA